MGNMSYCRFRNTLLDLEECEEYIGDFYDEDDYAISEEEKRAMIRLVQLCTEIAERHSDLI